LRIALAHARLHLGRLARGVTEVAETLQATVTRRLDEPTVMLLGDLRVNQLSPDRL
jgi:K+-transporting ATPase c subunit